MEIIFLAMVVGVIGIFISTDLVRIAAALEKLANPRDRPPVGLDAEQADKVRQSIDEKVLRDAEIDSMTGGWKNV